MEEVDNIIIHSLKQIGCDIDAEINSLKAFDTELVVKVTVKCLEIIKPDSSLNSTLPANMAARFRMGATLAQCCKDLGYKGDIGYQTFLYSSEVDLRRVLMFLLEKLPKDSDKSSCKPLKHKENVEKTISMEISRNLSRPWLPHYCHKKKATTSSLIVPLDLDSRIALWEQVPSQNQFLPSVTSIDSSSLSYTPLTIRQKIDWLVAQNYSHAMESQNSEDSQQSIQFSVSEAQEEIKKLVLQVKQVDAEQNNALKELNLLEEKQSVKIRAHEVLKGGAETVEKLRESIDNLVNKLVNLALQWEDHRVPLINKYREEKKNYGSKMKKLTDMKMLGEMERDLVEESRCKEQQYAQLLEEVKKRPKEINRSAYTQRILEIISNIRKQTDEIDKVLGDTREIQKEINSLNGRLERSFSLVDELIFRDARSNEASRKAYKMLASLHSDCNELIRLVEETGTTIREIRDLEEQVDLETSKNVSANLERITADLKQMRQETAALTAQLASKNS